MVNDNQAVLTMNVKDKRILEALRTFGINTTFCDGRYLIDTFWK